MFKALVNMIGNEAAAKIHTAAFPGLCEAISGATVG
jgi:hypothetical protein